ncbi:hypothetical protein WG66_013363 [Moniliophthora roreri]|uniref:Ty3 transposon capsid-like protein domain-containing protein n=1 Tax=Moniliophthora roreri TaxID=221103 RepID=A0A0W0FXQ6_MONRR|nr:hypothetical protein WG66_013363 [Moniliophthora roreri]
MSGTVPGQFKGLGQGGMNTNGRGTSADNSGANGNPSSHFVPPDWAPSAEHPTPPAVTWTDLFNVYHTVTQMGVSMNAITTHLSGLKTLDEGPKGIAKFKEPKPFDGKTSSVTRFLQDIRNTIQLSCRSLISDHDKCLYFSTYLGPGAPKEWYNSVELHNRELLDDFEKFVESFKKHFGNSNIVATAQNKLNELYQTGSAAQYIAHFNEWVIHLNLTDVSKIHMLY